MAEPIRNCFFNAFHFFASSYHLLPHFSLASPFFFSPFVFVLAGQWWSRLIDLFPSLLLKWANTDADEHEGSNSVAHRSTFPGLPRSQYGFFWSTFISLFSGIDCSFLLCVSFFFSLPSSRISRMSAVLQPQTRNYCIWKLALQSKPEIDDSQAFFTVHARVCSGTVAVSEHILACGSMSSKIVKINSRFLCLLLSLISGKLMPQGLPFSRQT